MNALFLVPLVTGAVVEWSFFFTAPVALSRLALIPVETRHLDPPLSTPPSTSLDLGLLAGSPRVDVADAALFFFARPPHVVSASRYTVVNKQRCLVRVGLFANEGRITLRGRCYPVGLPSLLQGFVWMAIMSGRMGPLVLAFLITIVFLALNRRACRRHIDMVATEVSSRLKSLAHSP